MKILRTTRIKKYTCPPEGVMRFVVESATKPTIEDFRYTRMAPRQEKYIRYYNPKLISEGGGLYVYEQVYRIPKPKLAAYARYASIKTMFVPVS